jgi:predicted ATPase
MGGKRMLVIFDNCEHIIDHVADLAVELMQAAPDIQFLATSREPLGVDGEHVYHVQALAVPGDSQDLGVEEALAFPAIRLFVERAADVLGDFNLAEEEVPAVCEICRKLDGVPLAIELAAASMPAFGLQGVVLGSDRPLQLPRIGRRNAPPRHKTLRAALDWSYALLSEGEKRVLQRLSMLPNEFSMERAVAVAAEPGEAKADVIDRVISLVMKSLVSVTRYGTDTELRLQSATRAYAAEKLGESGERIPSSAPPASGGLRAAGGYFLSRRETMPGDRNDRAYDLACNKSA